MKKKEPLSRDHANKLTATQLQNNSTSLSIYKVNFTSTFENRQLKILILQ